MGITQVAVMVGDGAAASREGRFEDVEADHLLSQAAQAADEGLAEMTGAARDQDFHVNLPSPALIKAATVHAGSCA